MNGSQGALWFKLGGYGVVEVLELSLGKRLKQHSKNLTYLKADYLENRIGYIET